MMKKPMLFDFLPDYLPAEVRIVQAIEHEDFEPAETKLCERKDIRIGKVTPESKVSVKNE